MVAAGADATEVVLPPSGFVCGNYARVDVERGVYKAPANEVVRGALRFERIVSKSEQDMLNPAGVNCLRFFEGAAIGSGGRANDLVRSGMEIRQYPALLHLS